MRLMRMMGAALAMLGLVVAVGCTSAASTQVGPNDVRASGLPHSATVIDAKEAGSLTSFAPTPQHFANFGVEGMEVFSPSPAGAMFIGQAGAAISDPKDASIGRVVMTFEAMPVEGGAPIIFTKRVEVENLNQVISEPIRAQAGQWEAWVDALRKLAEVDQAKFEQLMLTIRETAPAVADAIVQAIGKVVVPGP